MRPYVTFIKSPHKVFMAGEQLLIMNVKIIDSNKKCRISGRSGLAGLN